MLRSYDLERGQPEDRQELQSRAANRSWEGPEVLPEKVVSALSPEDRKELKWGKGIPRRGTE